MQELLLVRYGEIFLKGLNRPYFIRALVRKIRYAVRGLGAEQLTEMLRFANAAAYLVTTRKGAIRSMPEPEQVREILANH